MEFWGVEVKSGETLTVNPPKDKILHISQVALGEVKKDKGNEPARLYLKHAGHKFVIGTLSHEKWPQILLDLVLDNEFELSHSWKNGSIYFSGYHCDMPEESGSESEDDLKSNLPIPNPEVKSNATTTEPTEKKQVNFVKAEKDEESSDDVDDGDSSEDEDESNDEEMLDVDKNANDGDTSTDDEGSDESEETPAMSKKRSSDSAVKNPSQKKAKLVTPQKTDGKKMVGHIATPHPAKQAGKPSTSSGQAKQTPKSSGSFSCESCGRSFGSENALQSHSKAKHGSAA